jgi:hypothetical protein
VHDSKTNGLTAILPYEIKPGLAFARMPLEKLIWPFGMPEDLANGVVGDLKGEDEIICFPSKQICYQPRFGVKARISLMIVEPEAVHRRYFRAARLLHRRFHKILTCNPALLGEIPNGIFFTFGTTWIPDWRTLDIAKTRNLSVIASGKRDFEGHRLRHSTVDWLRGNNIDADIMGHGYRSFERKSDGLAPYRYSIVIENVREPSYFTEKLIDAFLSETVPIYWGAPDIAQFFDIEGMIICESFEDVQKAVVSADKVGYNNKSEAIARNKQRAADFEDLMTRAALTVRRGYDETSRVPRKPAPQV